LIPTPDEAGATGPDSGTPVAGEATAPQPESPIADGIPAATQAADRLQGVLDGLSARPLQEHAEVYAGLHADLHAALSQIDGA
jgi:hypothetical protein